MIDKKLHTWQWYVTMCLDIITGRLNKTCNIYIYIWKYIIQIYSILNTLLIEQKYNNLKKQIKNHIYLLFSFGRISNRKCKQTQDRHVAG